MAKSKTIRQFSAEWMDRIKSGIVRVERPFDSRSQRKRNVPDDSTLPDPSSVTYSGSCCCNETYCTKVPGTKEPLKPLYYRFALPAFRCGCTDLAEAAEFQLHPPDPAEGEEPDPSPMVFSSDPIRCLAPKGATIPCVQVTTYTWSAGDSDWVNPVNADDDCGCTATKPGFSGTEDGQESYPECESTKVADGTNDRADSFWQLTIVPTLTEAGGDETKLEFIIGSTVIFRYYLTRNIGKFRPFCRYCTNSFTIESPCGPSHCEKEPPGLICLTPSVGDLWITGGAVPECCTRPTIDGEPKLPRFIVLEVDLKKGTCLNDCCKAASGTYILEWNGWFWEYKFGECFTDTYCGSSDDCGTDIFPNVSLHSWRVGCFNAGLELQLSAFQWSMAAHPPGQPEIDCECGVDNCFQSNPLQMFSALADPAINGICFDADGLTFPHPGTDLCDDSVTARVRALTELP